VGDIAHGCFCCGRRCPGQCPWPQQAFRVEGSLPWRPPSWIPKGYSFPSGRDVFARQLSQRPTGLAIALICAPLWQCANFRPALSQRHLDLSLGVADFPSRQGVLMRHFSQRPVALAFMGSQRYFEHALISSWRLSLWLNGFAFALVQALLALSWQRLCLALALLQQCLVWLRIDFTSAPSFLCP